MTTEHDGVRDLLAAWAFGALPPAEERTVPPHLAECGTCAAEAERLRETVRLLDGTGARDTAERSADGVLAAALARRRPAAHRVAEHAAPYAAAVSGLAALLREAEGRWDTPVVHGWDVRDTVAHLLAADEHLALPLGLRARAPLTAVPDTRWQDAWSRRTADVIAHEHGRTPRHTVGSWSAQADALLGTPEARDPAPAARTVTLTGVRLPVADHFLVRAFETWIHTGDIGRALGFAVPPPPEDHLGRLVRLAVRVLGMTAPGTTSSPPVRLSVTGGEEWVLGGGDGADGPVCAELALDPVDLCLLVGGRQTPDAVPRHSTGDERAVRHVLERAAALAWL
ncbi:maleylpyruvate isomerase family mycothiol-dependent enzyme [Streptomyces sp. NPDC086787]|uniref:maleylpyruvate isomerase family mycothiol-dependent enzyme n=1 Tax=Streptomyces sp. NPDC086787 TaxID=3365759 RepID=UPI003829F614